MPLDIHEELLARRTILLDTPITDDAATTLIAKLLFLNAENPTAPVHLLIDSLGGSVAETLAIRDTMDAIDCPVDTKALTTAGGMAAVLLARGSRGIRSANPRAIVTLVPIASTNSAPHEQMARTESIVVEMLATDTRQSVDTIRRDMNASRSFTAAEALAYGLIDRVDESPR